jgi:hypothetical protein
MVQPDISADFLLLRAWVRISCADFKGKGNAYFPDISILRRNLIKLNMDLHSKFLRSPDLFRHTGTANFKTIYGIEEYIRLHISSHALYVYLNILMCFKISTSAHHHISKKSVNHPLPAGRVTQHSDPFSIAMPVCPAFFQAPGNCQ